jgi:hypothetical protein
LYNNDLTDLENEVNKGSFSKKYGGGLTYGDVFNEFATHIDFSKINLKTKIIMQNAAFNALRYGANTITATCAAIDTQNGAENIFIHIASGNSQYVLAYSTTIFDRTNTAISGEVTVAIEYQRIL